MKESLAEASARRWWVVVGALLAMVCFSTSRHLYPYVLPTMAADLGLPNERMGNIGSAYFVAYTFASFGWGILADRMGARRSMLLGIAIVGTGLLAMGFTDSFLLGFLFYLICGLGASGLSVPQVPLLSRWFPPTQRGFALGGAITGSGLAALALGLSVPVTLTVAGTWRWVWWSAAAVVFVLLVACWRLLAEPPARPQPSPSPAHHSSVDRHGLSRPPTAGDVLRLRAFWGLVAIYSLWGAGYTVFITFAVAYLREREWDPAAASGAFAAWGAAYMVAPMIWGSLGDRLGRKLVFALALIVQSVGCLAFITATPIGAFVGAAIVGFGLIGIPTGMSAAAGDYFPPPITGLAFGMLTVTFGLGCIIGPSVGGLLSDVSGTLQSGLLFGLGAVGASLLATALLERPPTAPGPAS